MKNLNDTESINIPKNSKWVFVKKDPQHLKYALNVGPVSLGIASSSVVFRSYKGGIIDTLECGDQGIDHSVLAVGYGNEDDQEFVIIKNSWGPYWGENGYARISLDTKKSKKGICGVLMQPILFYIQNDHQNWNNKVS